MADIFTRVDGWAWEEAARNNRFSRDRKIALALPGVGSLKAIVLLVLLPLLISEGIFIATGKALAPEVVELVLAALLGAFYWRVVIHMRALRSGYHLTDASNDG